MRACGCGPIVREQEVGEGSVSQTTHATPVSTPAAEAELLETSREGPSETCYGVCLSHPTRSGAAWSPTSRTSAANSSPPWPRSRGEGRTRQPEASICGQLLVTPMDITYAAERDEEKLAVVRHPCGPSWYCIGTARPGTRVVVFL